LSLDYFYSNSISSFAYYKSDLSAPSTTVLQNREYTNLDQQKTSATSLSDIEIISLPQETICDSTTFPFHSIPHTLICSSDEVFIPFDLSDNNSTLHLHSPTSDSGTYDPDALHINLATKKKYKPVALKVKPVIGELPAKFRIIRNIIGEPLEDLLTLNPNPPPFTPTGRYTQERKDLFDTAHPGFLLPAERDLLHHFMMLHDKAFAWDNSERGHFREDFFPPIDIPVVPHESQAMGTAKHTNSPRTIRQTLQISQNKTRCRSIRTLQLLIPLSLVLRSQERWQIASNSTIPRTPQRSHHRALRSSPIYRTTRRTIRWSRLQQHDGFICRIR
jgi:hypothetical protein